jgi:hypothetical protein
MFRPSGHRQAHRNQGVGTGEDHTSSHALVRGEHSEAYDPDVVLSDDDVDNVTQDRSGHTRNNFGSRLPKSDFPKFDGENPKWWKKNCEKYFKLYKVDTHLWVDFATMHFKGNAALWLQTYEALHSIETWPALCVGVFSKFNRDKYAKTIDIFFALKQIGSVDEYAHQFEELMHKVLLHNHAYDETFFVRRFIAGLKPEIRSAIKLHNPCTVDLAFSMAQTQEALLVEDSSSLPNKYAQRDTLRLKYKQHGQLPGFLGAPPDAKKYDEKPVTATRFDTLRAQRRAKGECFKCGEKYSPTHKCPNQVQLQVLEEILEALQISDSTRVETANEDSDSGDSQTEKMKKLSVHAVSGTTSRRSMRLQAQVGKYSALILIDSGSSANFISQQLVDRLQYPVSSMAPSKVSVAGGGTIECTGYLPAVTWHTQGHQFTADLKILPLGSYDIILGMYWLENQDNGKMWVNWQKKTMRFKHEGKRITLRGVQSIPNSCTAIPAHSLQGMLNSGEVCQLMELWPIEDDTIPPVAPPSFPEAVQKLLQ